VKPEAGSHLKPPWCGRFDGASTEDMLSFSEGEEEAVGKGLRWWWSETLESRNRKCPTCLREGGAGGGGLELEISMGN